MAVARHSKPRRRPATGFRLGLAVGLAMSAAIAGAAPPSPCTPAAQPATPVDWIVLGDGSPGSVSQADLQAALDTGGAIRFDLGPSPATLTLGSELVVSRATVLDGGGRVTLSGGGITRILRLTNPANAAYTVTLQSLTLADGAAPGGSGAAIYKASGGPWQAVTLELVGVTVRDGVAIPVAQDGGGGGLYATGLDEIRIHDSEFVGNRGSNGGALYSLGSRVLRVTDSRFFDNRATGDGGNPGNGGNGGAIGVDGAARTVELCNVSLLANRANAYGGAFFSVGYDDQSPTSFRHVTFDGNQNPGDDQFAGAAYLQGGPFSIRQSTFRRNEANAVGALFIGPGATGEIVNATFHDNLARQGLAGAISIETTRPVLILSSTIVGNRAPGTVAFAAGIRIGAANQLTLANTLLADNVGGNVWNPWNILNPAATDGGGNLQWPRYRPNGQEEVRATPTTIWADPRLHPPIRCGGPTATMPPLASSPARGAAATALLPSVDQRGVARTPPHDSGAHEAELLCDGFEVGLEGWTGAVP